MESGNASKSANTWASESGSKLRALSRLAGLVRYSLVPRNSHPWYIRRRVRLREAFGVREACFRFPTKLLGEIPVLRKGSETTFDFGEWKSAVAWRKNDDGTTSFVTIVPGFIGSAFVMGDKDGGRTSPSAMPSTSVSSPRKNNPPRRS